MTKYWTFGEAEKLDRRVERVDRAGRIVSNMNALRIDQIIGSLERADKKHGFLEKGKDLVIVDRSPEYLEEMMAKVVARLCPRHIVTHQNHHLPHYIVHDGRMTTYQNLDTESKIEMVIARGKHPDSIAEKVSRKTVYFGRVCERHDKYKLMMGDGFGFSAICKGKEYIDDVVDEILAMPFLRLEHFQRHAKGNGYNSTHLNLVYENGNPIMRGLEIEAQVTDSQSYNDSKEKPEQGHASAYGSEKLGSRHDLGERQLIIVGNHITIPEWLPVTEAEDARIVQVPNKIQPYTLVMPRSA